MKTLFFFWGILSLSITMAQNIGIGTGSPSEKLDVNGNINVAGTIKANGTDGAAGQVLMKNSSGNFSWGDIGDFKNVATFTDTSTTFINWNVPAGVTRVWVELWGGGGAGLIAGGGGGGYMSCLFNVTPAQSLLITVGKGGKDIPTVSGTLTYNQTGGDTRVDISSQYYIASGGGGAATSLVFSYAQYLAGFGGGYLTSTSVTISPRGPFYSQSGLSGGPYHLEYNSIGSNQYFRLGFYGNGGNAPNTGISVANGAYEEYSVIISPSSSTRTFYNSAHSGIFPGGGGGGGSALVNDQRAGANGLALIHY